MDMNIELRFVQDYEVWEQQWPQVDWRYGLDLICRLKGEEIVTKVERNYLDSMDEGTALQIALDLPEVQKLVPSGQCEIQRFNVEPGFRAVLSLKEKASPNDASPPSDSSSSFQNKSTSTIS